MSKVVATRFDTGRRVVTVDIENDFGDVSTHSFPLTADHCPHCGQALPGTNGVVDVKAAIAAAVSHVDELVDQVLPQFEAAGMDVTAVKAKRAAKVNANPQGGNSSGASVPGVQTTQSPPNTGSS